jgi:hypothetical protein
MCFLPRLNTHSPVTAGTMYAKCFLAKKGTYGSALGRGCRRWRRTAGKHHQGMELASCRQPCEFMPPLGGRLTATQDGDRSQPEERHGLAAAVLRIICRRKKPVRGVFGKIPVPNILGGAETRSMCPTNPSPSRYPVIDRLPKAVCVELS